MNDPVEPALTKEEWESPVDVFDGYVNMEEGTIDVQLGGAYYLDRETYDRQRKALAALLLRGYFTREDVSRLRAARKREVRKSVKMESVGANERARAFSDLADRIAALLPPREEKP